MHDRLDSQQPSPTAPRRLRVLVVEDNIDAQFLVCEMLAAFGHSATGTDNGEDALVKLASGQYDVLFSDVSLPGMSGLDLARRAIVRQPGLGVIFATGYGDALTARIDFPCVTLKKPYELDQLQDALARTGTANGVR